MSLPVITPVRSIVRRILQWVVMYLADTQWATVAVIQLGWVILLFGVSRGDGAHSAWDVVWRVLEWTGGTVSGRGDEHTLLAAWLKLSAVVFAIDALWGRMRGREPKPWPISRVVGAHAAVAAVGFALVAATVPNFAWWLSLVFVLLCALGAAWAMACRRLAEAINRLIGD